MTNNQFGQGGFSFNRSFNSYYSFNSSYNHNSFHGSSFFPVQNRFSFSSYKGLTEMHGSHNLNENRIYFDKSEKRSFMFTPKNHLNPPFNTFSQNHVADNYPKVNCSHLYSKKFSEASDYFSSEKNSKDSTNNSQGNSALQISDDESREKELFESVNEIILENKLRNGFNAHKSDSLEQFGYEYFLKRLYLSRKSYVNIDLKSIEIINKCENEVLCLIEKILEKNDENELYMLCFILNFLSSEKISQIWRSLIKLNTAPKLSTSEKTHTFMLKLIEITHQYESIHKKVFISYGKTLSYLVMDYYGSLIVQKLVCLKNRRNSIEKLIFKRISDLAVNIHASQVVIAFIDFNKENQSKIQEFLKLITSNINMFIRNEYANNILLKVIDIAVCEDLKEITELCKSKLIKLSMSKFGSFFVQSMIEKKIIVSWIFIF